MKNKILNIINVICIVINIVFLLSSYNDLSVINRFNIFLIINIIYATVYFLSLIYSVNITDNCLYISLYSTVSMLLIYLIQFVYNIKGFGFGIVNNAVFVFKYVYIILIVWLLMIIKSSKKSK